MASVLRLIRKWFGYGQESLDTALKDGSDVEHVLAASRTFSVESLDPLYAAASKGSDPNDEINPGHDFFEKGLPPDWWARKLATLRRDESRCQVTGCINTTGLDVHHIKPRFEVIDHRLSNLVALCRLHHALLPFHSQARERFNSERYTSVSAHWKWNIFHTKRFPVRPHIKRFERVNISDLGAIKKTFGLMCKCGSPDLRARIDEHRERVRVRCPSCHHLWFFERGLREEIGVQFAAVFKVTEKPGRFPFAADQLEVKNPIKAFSCPECAQSGIIAELKLIQGPYGKFWGCPNWNGNKMHFKRRWQECDELQA